MNDQWFTTASINAVRFAANAILALLCGPAVFTTALAGDAPAPTHGDGTFQLTPYFWAASMKGDVSPFRRGPILHVDKSFSNILKDLEFGGFLQLWARRDRWVLSGDLMYVDTASEQTSGQLPQLPPPLPAISSVGAKVRTKEFTASLMAGYRLYDAPGFTFDLLGGARGWHISNQVSVWTGSQSGSYQESFGWIDPAVGARAFFRLSDRFTALLQGDVGGFGAGSKHSYHLL
ncbi:MAG: hypothetical protein AB7E55_29160, partial [Pigmentiphaga sp.]